MNEEKKQGAKNKLNIYLTYFILSDRKWNRKLQHMNNTGETTFLITAYFLLQ